MLFLQKLYHDLITSPQPQYLKPSEKIFFQDAGLEWIKPYEEYSQLKHPESYDWVEEEALESHIQDFNLKYCFSCSSTLDFLENNQSGEMIYWADYQSAGRGQRERQWQSFLGRQLLLSIAASSERGWLYHSLYPIFVFLKLLNQWGIEDVYYKWPNDLYKLNMAKVGGFLLSKKNHQDHISLGLNTTLPFFQGEFLRASLWPEQKHLYKRIDMIQSYLKAFENLKATSIEEMTTFLEAKHLIAVGENIEILSQSTLKKGFFFKIGVHGQLIIRDLEGKEESFYDARIILPKK